MQWLCWHKPGTESVEVKLEKEEGKMTLIDIIGGSETVAQRIPVPESAKALAFAVEVTRGGLPVRIQGGQFQAPPRLARASCFRLPGKDASLC